MQKGRSSTNKPNCQTGRIQESLSRRCGRGIAVVGAVKETVRGASAKIDDPTNLDFPLFIFTRLKLQTFLANLHPNGLIPAKACEQLLRQRLHPRTGRRECAGLRRESLLWFSRRSVAWAKQGNQRNRHSYSAITRMKYVTRHSSRCPRDPAGCDDSPIL